MTAYVEVDEPQTAALAKALLEPLMTWQGSSKGLEAETTWH